MMFKSRFQATQVTVVGLYETSVSVSIPVLHISVPSIMSCRNDIYVFIILNVQLTLSYRSTSVTIWNTLQRG